MIWTCSQAEKQVLGYAIRGREGKIQGHIGGFHLKSRRFCHCELGKRQRMWEEETFWSVEGVETGQKEYKIQEGQRERDGDWELSQKCESTICLEILPLVRPFIILCPAKSGFLHSAKEIFELSALRLKRSHLASALPVWSREWALLVLRTKT